MFADFCWSFYYLVLFFFETNMCKFLIEIYSFLPASDLDEPESMGPRLQSSFKHIHEVCSFLYALFISLWLDKTQT